MIDNALKFVVNEVNKYVIRKIDPSQDPSISKWIVLGNIAKVQDPDPTGGSNPLLGKGILSLVNVEEDRVSKLPNNYVKVGDRIEYRNPKIFLNLYLLFAVNHATYETSLQYLSMIIQCFQYKNVINHQNSPDSAEAKLDPRIDKLIFDLHTLGFEQLNQLWAVLGGKYLPSVVYKMRLVTIEDLTPDMQGDPITSISIKDGSMAG